MPAKNRKWHFGVLSFAGTGHLNPLIALAQELTSRGHQVTFFDKPKIGARVREAGLEFVPVGETAPIARREATTNHTRMRAELAQLRLNVTRICRELESFLEETPDALTRAGVNALLVDEIALTGPTVAELLGLPYFIVSITFPHLFGWEGSAWVSGYRHSNSWLSGLQGAFLELSVTRMRGPIRRTLEQYRKRAGLGKVSGIQNEYPCLAHITQMPKCLDLPNRLVPADFHYAGPFAWRSERPYVAFPWDQLDGRPMIYASLGTTRAVQPAIFRMIAEACCDLDVQLVISLGNRVAPDSLPDLPGRPIVVDYAPQLEVLKRAEIVITHGGSNTVFETLMEGKPMVTIPLAYDQPAVAARLARLGIAEVLPVMRLSAKRIQNAIKKVREERSYREAAQEIRMKLRAIRGVDMAVQILEGALRRYVLEKEARIRAERHETDPKQAQVREVRYISRTNRSSILTPSSRSQYRRL